jgi:energy-coupling factor transport system permease protein
MHARAAAAWSAACLAVILSTTNPVYRALVLVAALVVVVGVAGAARARRPLLVAGAVAGWGVVLNFLVSHVGRHALFVLPDGVPAFGGPYTAESLVYGLVTGISLAAAVLAVAPITLFLEAHEIVDALPRALARSGGAVAAALNLVPTLATSFVAVTEAQRLRGWRPRGPRSWAEVVVPVVLTAVEDSIQLAESMEARAFGSGPRTHLRRARLSPADRVVAGVALAAAAVFVGARLAGWVDDWYPYPEPQLPGLNPVPAAACLALLVPVFLPHSLGKMAC